MKEPDDLEILSAMLIYGGGFAKALAHAARLADSNNLEKIKATWPEYWTRYRELALLDRKHEE